jgi:alpha-tubulin suppressor-like RCC1 family protein
MTPNQVNCTPCDSQCKLAAPQPLQISAGLRYTCALRQGGAVSCWGFNGAGQLGDGTTTSRLAPTPVTGLTDAIQISAGERHACALRQGGGVSCWGHNRFGRLGDGTLDGERLTPTPVVWP